MSVNYLFSPNDYVIYAGDLEVTTINHAAYPPSSTPLTVVAPVSASDNNGLQITGSNINLEIANAAFPGIVSSTIQTFDGQKNFPAGITVPKFYTASVASTVGSAFIGNFSINLESNGIDMVSIVIRCLQTDLAATQTATVVIPAGTIPSAPPLNFRPLIAQQIPFYYTNGTGTTINTTPKIQGSAIIETDGSIILIGDVGYGSAGGENNGVFTNGNFYNIQNISGVYSLLD